MNVTGPNKTHPTCSGRHPDGWAPTDPNCVIQRPKLVEFVDCQDVSLMGGDRPTTVPQIGTHYLPCAFLFTPI